MLDLTDRRKFLAVALLFEGSLVGIAQSIGYWCDVGPWSRFEWSLSAFGSGVAATLPIFALFAISYRRPIGPLREIKNLLIQTLGPSLARCRWYDLLLLAAVAGIGEEALFRGVLQPWLGLAWSNVLFGLAHSASPLYALLAGAVGGYFGWLLDATDNLLTPIVTHGLYDFLAFLVVARDCRRQAGTLQSVIPTE
ncbi:MAG: CPBP family intramembrane metalloprotease [Planctomycetaceae bacterium]|nr:CPBP family intramembrane metalloprotease [Planctomycetaceae bacterium]